MEHCLIIVARDEPALLARLNAIYAQDPAVEVRVDRRQGLPWAGPSTPPTRRAPRHPDTDLQDHGSIVVLR